MQLFALSKVSGGLYSNEFKNMSVKYISCLDVIKISY